jgi:hypothetical protein
MSPGRSHPLAGEPELVHGVVNEAAPSVVQPREDQDAKQNNPAPNSHPYSQQNA